MAASIKTLSRLRIGSTVLPATNVTIQDSIVAAPQSHSGLQQADNLLVAGGEAPRVIAQVPWGEAFATFGLTTLDVATLEIYLGSVTGGIVGGTDAVRYSLKAAASAVGYITGFSVAQDGVAFADVEIVCLSADGSADPLERVAAQTPPAVGQPDLYTLGGVAVNGTTIDGATGTSLAIGWSVSTQRTDGDFFPTAAVCGGAAPVLSVTHVSPDTVRETLGSIGVGISTTAVVTLKGVANETGIVGGTTQTLTISDGYVAPGGLDLPHVQIGSHTFTLHAISTDGSTSGVVVA